MNLTHVIWSIIIGIGVATVYLFYTRKILGKLVRKLITLDACSPENAVSLKEINYKMNPFVKYALREGTLFSETVIATREGLYYINPKQLDKAKSKFKNEGTNVFMLLITLLIFAIFALISTYLFSEAVNSFTNFINSLFN